MSDLSFPLAFLAGVLSFLSPCVLPLVPSYISFITGMSFEDLTDKDTKRITFATLANSLVFSLGFSTVFVSLGASSSLIGLWFFQFQDWIRIVGGVLVIVFGLFIAGVLKMDFLQRERKFHLRGRPAGYIGTFLIGMTFAAAWTPCIGPILGSILLVASSEGSTAYGIELLSVYSLGLAIPFMASALAFNSFLNYSKNIRKYMRAVMIISGIILVVFGVLLLTDRLRDLSAYLPDLGIKL
jgi:cytochrome c-type biogenesis protein